MFIVFDYDDEKYVCGMRKNAVTLCNNRFDALHFSSKEIAEMFVSVLKELYPDVYFRVLPFE